MAENDDVVVEGQDPPVVEPKPDPTVDAVRAIADEFKRGLAEARASAVPPVVAAPVGPSVEDRQRAQAAEYEQIRARVNELAAEGKVAEGNELYVQWLARQSQQSQIAVTDHPIFKSQVELAQREVKRDNPEAFGRWGSEVQAEIASYPPETRVMPSTWERALQSVKARHMDEIIEETVKERTKGLPPSAAGSRGNAGTPGGGATNLNTSELGVAKSLGITPEEYRKSRDSMTAYAQPDGAIMGVPILDDKVQPGRF